MRSALAAALLTAVLPLMAPAASPILIPATHPADDPPYWRTMEASGTVVLYAFRSNKEYDVTSGRWWQAGWYDTFVWRPGFDAAAIYGWEAVHLTADGRWLVVRRYNQVPQIRAVMPMLENRRRVFWLHCDFDHDGRVDQTDWGLMQQQLGKFGPLAADLDGDGAVDDTDTQLFWRVFAEQQPQNR